MYCTKCGHRMQFDAQFCSSCGTPVEGWSGSGRTGESSVPLLSLRPVFVPWAAWLSIFPLQIFFTIWGGGFFGGFSMFAVRAIGMDVPSGSTFVFFGLLFFIAIPISAYVIQKKTYAKTEYVFYRTKLEYYEGFFASERKTIEYRHINEVNLRCGVVQKQYGLGTIALSTSATGFGVGRARSGIRIADIPHAEQAYEQIKEMIRGASHARVA